MQDNILGTFHFHSTYSHDGRSTLAEIVSKLRGQKFSFCIMTEHFEDFDAAKFGDYLAEVKTLNQAGDFVLVPGVEVHLTGVDTILFPSLQYQACVRFASDGIDPEQRMFKVLAHPSKYPFEKVSRHLETYRLNGIELWNQQADSSYLPPFEFLQSLKTHSLRGEYHYLFGCDLHDANLTVSNYVSLPRPAQLNVEGVMARITKGEFLTANMKTGIEYRNGPGRSDLNEWLKPILQGSYRRGRLLRGVRNILKGFYRLLPRPMKHSLNDFKNLVRNKV